MIIRLHKKIETINLAERLVLAKQSFTLFGDLKTLLEMEMKKKSYVFTLDNVSKINVTT